MNNHLNDIDQDYKIWWLILGMRRAMHKARAKELFQYGITPEEASVLFVVNAIGDKATPAEVSRWVLREPHSVSSLLSRMEKDRLVGAVGGVFWTPARFLNNCVARVPLYPFTKTSRSWSPSKSPHSTLE